MPTGSLIGGLVRCSLHAGNNGYVWLSRALTGEGAEEADDVEGNLMSAKAEVRGRHVLSSPVAITPLMSRNGVSCRAAAHGTEEAARRDTDDRRRETPHRPGTELHRSARSGAVLGPVCLSGSMPFAEPLLLSFVVRAQEFLSISAETIQRVYSLSEGLGIAPKDMLTAKGSQAILTRLMAEHGDGRHA